MFAIGRGFNRFSYNRMFLNSLKPKALLKLAQHPGLFDRGRLVAAKTVMAFDDVFNGPLHGFSGAADYYARGSAKPRRSAPRPKLMQRARRKDDKQ